MSLCGLWHGLTIPFLLWGLLHGAGLAAHQLWLRARRASAPLDGFAGSIAGRTVGAVVTVHYVAFTWIFFSAGDLGVALANLRGVAGAIPGALDGVAASAVAVALWSFLPGSATSCAGPPRPRPRRSARTWRRSGAPTSM